MVRSVDYGDSAAAPVDVPRSTFSCDIARPVSLAAAAQDFVPGGFFPLVTT